MLLLPDVDLSEDPDDNPLLAMAIAGDVDYLVSGDKRDVLALKKVGKTSIVTARRFLTIIQMWTLCRSCGRYCSRALYVRP